VRHPGLGVNVSGQASGLRCADNYLRDYRPPASPHFFPEHRRGRLGALRRPVASIQLNELLEKNGGAGGPLDQDQDNVVNDANAHTATAGGACVASREYDNAAWAVVNFPSGYTPTTGSLHGNASLTPTASACAPPPPPGGGGGGGGGCAVTAPSPVAQPPADRSRLISCQ